ncbi:MAG: hypothetical protein KME21_01990 [Desmonostoc vinosum HA7617-LM4]|nr:hypothetical protein [Desmonostoc vinosum HA7617-LM4]
MGIGDWGLGTGDWGLGTGDWGLGKRMRGCGENFSFISRLVSEVEPHPPAPSLRSFNFYLLKLYSVPTQEYDDLLVKQIKDCTSRFVLYKKLFVL